MKTTTKLTLLIALLISGLLLIAACTEGSVNSTSGSNKKETFPQVAVEDGYHLLGSSGTMPPALASEVFEAGGTPKAEALIAAKFTGNASEYVWVAHVKQYGFDDEAYAGAPLPDDNKYVELLVLQEDENITAYVGFSKTGSIGNGAKLALIYNDYSQEFTRHLSEWNSDTPDDDAFFLSYEEGADGGVEYGSGNILMHFNTTQPDATTFDTCTRVDDDDIWNELSLNIDRDTDLCTIRYTVTFNAVFPNYAFYFNRQGVKLLESDFETITVDGDVTFSYGDGSRFNFYPPAGAFGSASKAGAFFKRITGE